MAENSSKKPQDRHVAKLKLAGKLLAGISALGFGGHKALEYHDKANDEKQTLRMYQHAIIDEQRKEMILMADKADKDFEAKIIQKRINDNIAAGVVNNEALKEALKRYNYLSQAMGKAVKDHEKEESELQQLANFSQNKIDDANNKAQGAFNTGILGGIISALTVISGRKKPAEIIRYSFHDHEQAAKAMDSINKELASRYPVKLFEVGVDPYTHHSYPVLEGKVDVSLVEIASFEYNGTGRRAYIELNAGQSEDDRYYLPKLLEDTAREYSGRKVSLPQRAR